jgi:hypothetical protein
MRQDSVIQFVCFETILDKGPFMAKWEHFTRSVGSDQDVTLQQSKKDDHFMYLAQHRCTTGQFKFFFEQTKRSSKDREISIRAKPIGGYSLLQSERKFSSAKGEIKLFAFITDNRADLEPYKKLAEKGDLNIYEPYYENSSYAYILEYFIHHSHAEELLGQLKQLDANEAGIYKEFILQLS